MTAMQALPKDSLIMIAWEKYKATDEYANSRKWAAQEQHVDGSMWAAFLSGYQAFAPSQPAPVVVTKEPQTWGVSVSADGEEIVCIETNMLSGRDIGDFERETIRKAAHHLLAFIGDPDPLFQPAPVVADNE